MNHWQRLSLPLTLGLGAAALNWWSVTSVLEPHQYVTPTRDIAAGEQIREDDVSPLLLRHDRVDLSAVFFSWNERDLVHNGTASRDLRRGIPVAVGDVVSDPMGRLQDGETAVTIASTFKATFFEGDVLEVRTSDREAGIPCRVLGIAPADQEHPSETRLTLAFREFDAARHLRDNPRCITGLSLLAPPPLALDAAPESEQSTAPLDQRASHDTTSES